MAAHPPARQPAPLPELVHADAILLDLDGTLVDTTASVEAAWAWGAEQLGLPFEAVQPYMHGIPPVQVIERLAPQVTPQDARALDRAMLGRMAATDESGVTHQPGARALLDELTAHPGARWAIVTSGDWQLAGSSLRFAPVPRPDVMITAEDVDRGKPHPDPYLRAAAALGVDPARCLVVEDAPAGIAAARAAGTKVLALTTTTPAAALADADWVIGSLADVVAHVTPDGGIDLRPSPRDARGD